MGKSKSAGIVLYRYNQPETEVFPVMHGGPFWAGKDIGAWSIPKGEFDESETALAAAIREFHEETGILLQGDFTELTPIVQKAGKQVFAFAHKGNLDADSIISNTFTIQWPPKSGKWQTFPEVANAAWFPISVAKEKINAAQAPLLDELLEKLRT